MKLYHEAGVNLVSSNHFVVSEEVYNKL